MNLKSIKVLSAAAIVAFTVSCKDAENEVEATAEKDVAEATSSAVTYNVDTAGSSIEWTGSKVGGSHNGTIAITDGMVSVNGETVESGKFNIDMSSIKVTDLEGEQAASLKGHLESGDFFSAKEFPNATFNVTGITSKDNKTMLNGNLTMKDITKNITFPVDVKYDGNKMMLTSETFTIDRTDWGIKYGSSSLADIAKDKVISDDIELKVNLVASR